MDSATIFARVNWVVLPVVIVVLLVLLALLLIFMSFFRHWMRAFLSGAPISLFQLLGMSMRKVNPAKVLPHGIAATQSGHPIGWVELERAYLQGTDLEKVTTACITSQEQGKGFTFQELVVADRESRLAEMLKLNRS